MKTIFLDATGVILGEGTEEHGSVMDLVTFQTQIDATATQRITGAPKEVRHKNYPSGYHTKISGDGTDISNYSFIAYSEVQYEAVHKVDTKICGKLQSRTWYQTDNGDGTFSDLSKDEIYTWNKNKLISVVFTEYYIDSRVATQKTETYSTSSEKHIVRRTKNV